MLDKTIPYYSVIMIREKAREFREIPLPEGFHYDLFKPGDEEDWARIETGVHEFPGTGEARKYFEKEYLIYERELSERCLFLSTERDEKIGTATAWWSFRQESRVPSLHWVSLLPGYQKRGLGKSLISRAMGISAELDGNGDSFIHTQTWSYPAIGIYLQGGYRILRKGTFGNYRNDYEEALPYLQRKMGRYFSADRDTTILDDTGRIPKH